MRGIAKGALLAAMMLVALPAGASAALVWGSAGASDQEHALWLTGATCPSSSLCVAVDQAGRVFTFDPSAPRDPVPRTLEGGVEFVAVACPMLTECVALGTNGREVTFDPTSSAPPSYAQVGTGLEVGLACPSSTQCTALGSEEVTFNPQSPATTMTADLDDSGYALSGIACASIDVCTLTDYGGNVLTFDPNNPGNPSPTQLTASLDAISCPTTWQCTAVGTGEFTFDPTDPAGASSSTVGSGRQITCVSAGQCTSTNDNNETTFDPVSPAGSLSYTIDGSGDYITAIGCSSSSNCTAVDEQGQIVPFAPASPETARSVAIDNSYKFTDLGCDSPIQCVAVGADQLLTIGADSSGYNGDQVPLPNPSPLDSSAAPTAVSCPTASDCVAVDGAGGAFSFSPRPQNGSMADVPSIDSQGEPVAVSCPETGQCTAVDNVGNEVTFGIEAGVATEKVVGRVLESIDAASLTAVSCPNGAQCTAVDDDGHAVTFEPPGGAPDYFDIDGVSALTGISCPAANECAAVDADGSEVTFDPTDPGTPSPTSIDPGHRLNAISCPTTSFCVAVDDAGFEFEFDPQEIPSPTFAASQLTGADSLLSVSCLYASECVTIDAQGFIWVGHGASTSSPTRSGSSGGDGSQARAGRPSLSRIRLSAGSGGVERLRFTVDAGSNAPGLASLAVSLGTDLKIIRRDVTAAGSKSLSIRGSRVVVVVLKGARTSATVTVKFKLSHGRLSRVRKLTARFTVAVTNATGTITRLTARADS